MHSWRLAVLLENDHTFILKICHTMKDHDFNLEYVLNILKLRKPEFAVSYGVSAIGVFGSLARGEEKPDSDVDVVVEMKKPDLFYMVHIKESLEEDLQCPVDVVRLRERMNPYLKTRIKKEAVYV